jgi:hypothetical protein
MSWGQDWSQLAPRVGLSPCAIPSLAWRGVYRE